MLFPPKSEGTWGVLHCAISKDSGQEDFNTLARNASKPHSNVTQTTIWAPFKYPIHSESVISGLTDELQHNVTWQLN